MSKVLCPVDFSDASLNAVEYAAHVSVKTESSLKLVNVFTEKEFNTIVSKPDINYSFKELLSMARNRLDVIRKEVLGNFGSKGLNHIEVSVELGEFIDYLVGESRKKEYDLIVMGTSGVGKSLWFGSNTSQLISKSHTPVLSVPKDAVYQGFRKMVYATDINEEDKIKIQEVISFATQFDSRVYVLHLTPENDPIERNELDLFFEELKSFVDYPRISYEGRDYKGNVGHSLMDFVNEKESGLLVVYSRNRSYVENLMHKSVAQELAITSYKPLMVLK